jgi:endogenous inhibitor of DNA gyrase (YacG/DUF329 family)
MIRPVTCPVCDKQIVTDFASEPNGSPLPICSDRCRRIDLFRWFDGRYAVTEDLSPDQLADAASAEFSLDELSGDEI